MSFLVLLRDRRRRAVLLAGTALVWVVASVGAFMGNRALLGAGLVLAGGLSISVSKILMEVHSSKRVVELAGRDGRTVEPVPVNRAQSAPPDGRLELYEDRAISGNNELCKVVREALIKHHFSKLTGWTDDEGPERFSVDLDRHTYMRHDSAVTYIVPWVNQSVPLKGSSIVEIGCGTGSSTAAFAAFADIVHGYDISTSSIAAANVRLDAHGLAERVDLVVSPPADLLSSVEEHHGAASVDIVLLYALLEHQTLDERIQTLRLAQRIVKPGGAIVITETPNRLTYFDRHTSQLPFFHMLPIELQLLYADRSPRENFAANVAAHQARQPGDAALRELLIRWGQSVSFHDFEVAIGDINERILSSGLHPNLMKLRPQRPEEEPLRDFLRSTDLSVHPGFTRYYLDLIIAAA
jgi:ubiquinone/menaquinone biosynthesis C-methylase UbiE